MRKGGKEDRWWIYRHRRGDEGVKIGKHYQATQSYFPVSGPTNHLKITRPPVFFLFILGSQSGRKWCTNSKVHLTGLGTRLQNTDTCGSKI